MAASTAIDELQRNCLMSTHGVLPAHIRFSHHFLNSKRSCLVVSCPALVTIALVGVDFVDSLEMRWHAALANSYL